MGLFDREGVQERHWREAGSMPCRRRGKIHMSKKSDEASKRRLEMENAGSWRRTVKGFAGSDPASEWAKTSAERQARKTKEVDASGADSGSNLAAQALLRAPGSGPCCLAPRFGSGEAPP